MNEPQVELSSGNLIGTRLDDYQVLRRLGRGGMADVYVALHQSLDRQVALKVLRRQLAGDSEYVERFRREARAAAKLNHPNIVQVYEVGRTGDYHYIAQELIDGPNLKDRVSKEGPLTPAEAVEVLAAVAAALEVAHQAGITHRDIKPENILQSRQGGYKVADFGLARLGVGGDLTQAGLTMGTPRYMSPEQVQGRSVDARSDLYSLGCTLYFLLSGSPPFEGDEPLAVALQHLHETPRPLAKVRGTDDIPDWLAAAINRLMAKAPADRFGSAAELAQWIAEQSGQSGWTISGGMALPPGTAGATIMLQRAMEVEARHRRRRRLRLTAAALVPVLAALLGSWAAAPRRPQSITRLLHPESVPRRETIEQQYLVAISRNDIAAWRAVSEYFPPSKNANYAAYAWKADLQLARLLLSQGRRGEAEELLTAIGKNSSVEPLYRLVALAELVDLVEPQQATRLWKEMRLTYSTLIKSNPEVDRALADIIGSEKWARLRTDAG